MSDKFTDLPPGATLVNEPAKQAPTFTDLPKGATVVSVPEPTLRSETMGVLGQANSGIAGVLGIAGDSINWGLRQIGVGNQDIGTDAIKSGMRWLGIEVDARPETLPGKVIGAGVEGAATAAMLVGPGAKAAQAGGTIVPAIGKAFSEAPVAQALGGAGANIGANMAREADLGPLAEMGAGLAGGIVGTTAGLRTAAGRGPAVSARVAGKQQVAQDFADQAVPMTGVSVGGPNMQLAGKTLRVAPGGGGVIQRSAENQIAAVKAARDRAARSYGNMQDTGTTGRMIQGATERFARGTPTGSPLAQMGPFGIMPPKQIIAQSVGKVGFRAKSAALYDRIAAQVDPWLTFDPKNTREALRAQRFNDPGLEAEFKSGTLKRWADLVGDAPAARSNLPARLGDPGNASRGMTWNDLRNFRTELGYMLDDPKLTTDTSQARLKAVYGALSKDIEEATQQISPDLYRQLKRADRFYAAGQKRIKDTLSKFFGANGGEEAYARLHRAATKGAGENSRQVHALKRSMSREDWSEVSSTFIAEMGAPTPSQASLGQDFNVSRFFANYEKLTPSAKLALFDGAGQRELRQNLDQILRVAGKVSQAENFANPSGTGGIAVGGMFGGLAVTNFKAAALAAIGSHVGARLVTNPRVAKFVATPYARGSRTALDAQIRDLTRYAARQEARDPALAQAILTYTRKIGEIRELAAGEPETPATASPVR